MDQERVNSLSKLFSIDASKTKTKDKFCFIVSLIFFFSFFQKLSYNFEHKHNLELKKYMKIKFTMMLEFLQGHLRSDNDWIVQQLAPLSEQQLEDLYYHLEERFLLE